MEKIHMNAPTPKLFAAIAAAALLAISIPAMALAGDTMIQPSSPQAARTITQLKHAAYIDRQDAKAHSGAEDSDLGIYYGHKAKEAEALVKKLTSGEAVSHSEVEQALNTKEAAHYRAY
jgi:hypothetical protein